MSVTSEVTSRLLQPCYIVNNLQGWESLYVSGVNRENQFQWKLIKFPDNFKPYVCMYH